MEGPSSKNPGLGQGKPAIPDEESDDCSHTLGKDCAGMSRSIGVKLMDEL
jgi:hypothetical protein